MSSYSRLVGRDGVYRELKILFKREHATCARCHKYIPYRKRTVDHIIPMWQYNGSPYEMNNWQMLCQPCHTQKTKEDGVPIV